MFVIKEIATRNFVGHHERSLVFPATGIVLVRPPVLSLDCYRKRFARHVALGAWCRSRRGQVIACENVGATWLPFRPFLVTKGLEGRRGGKRSAEAIWLDGEVAA